MKENERRIQFAKELIHRYREHYKVGVLSKEEMKSKIKELKLFIMKQKGE